MEGGYSAGNLELSILGFSEKAVASIDVTAKALRRLASAVDKINSTRLVFAGDKLEVLFTKIARATNSINTQNIENLAVAAKSLASISRISNLEKMDFGKVGQGFNTLSIAIEPFLNKVKEAEASLTALDGVLRRTSGRKIQGLLDGGKGKSKDGIFGLAKLGTSLFLMRRMGRFMGDLVQAGSDYTETLNLWQVAMRNNLDSADEFVNKMQKAYGISSKTLMNAQAIFKNMIGSLGQISDQTAYALSEALVQMSADFSSLYNVKLEQAFEKMQSMLAGQVRPIRSAGLDMTETTLYQFYQQIGGTKTMRQLNRTEKQLLSILAVYQQMGSAGALGDMSKTLNQFANQSRMMTEYWAELKTWSGLLLKDLIDQSGMLVYINALLIVTTEIVRSIAKSRGLGNENFLDDMFESAEATNGEIDELQGKLLDFDKFRSLEGATASPIAIDEKLLEAITGYSSKIDDARNAAQELAKEWMLALGWTEKENGQLVISEENLEKIKDTLNLIGIALGVIVGLGVIAGVVQLATAIFKLKNILVATELVLVAGIIYSIVEAVKAFRDGDTMAGIFATAIGVTLVGAFILLNTVLIASKLKADGVAMSIARIAAQGALLTVGLGLLVAGVSAFISAWGDMGWGQRILTIITAITAALVGMWIAANALGMTPLGAIAVGAALAGGIALISSQIKIPNFEDGASDIDSGTVFRAGEFGKTEAVYSGSNGKTNVANVRQMEQAFYNALYRHSKDGNGTIIVQAYLDGEKVYENTTSRARAKGYKWSKA